MIRQLTTGLAVLALTLALVDHIQAGTIIGVASVSGGGNAVVNPIVTGDPNNDNHSLPATSNIAVVSKLFNAHQPIDIVFDVATSSGVTEYRIAEGIANVSGIDFLSFAFELGFGRGASFVRSLPGDGLDFDSPNIDPGPTSARFLTMAHSEDLLRFTQGAIPNGQTDAFTLSIDVPDFNPNLMPASARVNGGYRFTLRQFPVAIPEPGTIGIAVLSALAWVVFTLRRRWG